MAIFGKSNDKKSTPIFDVINYKFTNDEEIAYLFHRQNFNTQSILTVLPGQEAIFICDGRVCDIFSDGRYELNTNNIPILTKLLSIPYGANQIFTCQIVFINKDKEFSVKWGTPSSLKVKDPGSGRLVKVQSRGQFSVKINDSAVFYSKLLSQINEYLVDDISDFIFAKAQEVITDKIGKAIVGDRYPLTEMDAHRTEISDKIYSQLSSDGLFEKYGLKINTFSITSLSMPEEDWKALQEYENKYLEEIRKIDILKYKGDIYDKELTHDVLKTAAGNTSSGGMMNMGMGLGMGLGVGAGFGGAMNSMTANMVTPGAQSNQQPSVLCPNCKKVNPADAKFCHSCGTTLSVATTTCPKCKTENDADSAFCKNCGANLKIATGKQCPNCNADNDITSKFCHKCGTPLTPTKPICPNCNAENEPNSLFCSKCGTKIGG